MSSGTDSALRLRIQGAVLIIVIFVVGVLAGGAGERIRASCERPMGSFRQSGELPRPFGRLGLTEEQQTEIFEIFEIFGPRADSILHELMPRLRAISDSIHDQVDEILTPEQREMLDEAFERRGEFPRGMGGPWRRPFVTDSMPGSGMGPFPPDSPPGYRSRPRRPGG